MVAAGAPFSPPSSLFWAANFCTQLDGRPEGENNLLTKEIVKLDAQIAISGSRESQATLGRAHGDHRETAAASGQRSCISSMKS